MVSRMGLVGLAAGIIGASLAGPAISAPIDLASHRAVYDLTLGEPGGAGTMLDLSGRLVVEFTGSLCAGYTSRLRFVTRTEDADGGDQITDARASTFESADGRSLEFSNETYTDDRLAEESSGKASREDRGVAVSLTKPSRKTLALADSVVFPAEQMERIIASAARGESFVQFDVYDGSEDGETVFVTAGVIGKASTADNDLGSETAIAAAGLAGMRHWPVTISYFNKAAPGDTTPFYVLSFVIYENGIGRALKIDYGDLSLAGTLKMLELLPAEPCS